MPDPLYPREPSFALGELTGGSVETARERCEREDFAVQVIDLDTTGYVTLDLRANRIRLFARRGVVERCHQG